MAAERLRVCIVTPNHSSCTNGGAEYQIDLLVQQLVRADKYDIHYLASNVDPACQPSGYEIVRIGHSGQAPRLGYWAHLLPLYRALRRIKPQVIYQRIACGYSGIAALYASNTHTRLVFHIAHESDLALASPDPGRNPLRQALESYGIRRCIRDADHIIAQTERQAQLLQSMHGRSASAVIPNWHPDATERLDKSGAATVLWVANLKSWKRPEVFVELANALRDLPAVRFIMIGAAASGAWNTELLRRIAATPNLQYLGPRSQREVNALLATAHVFVNSSVAEGFPNTYVQAWLREVPVVALSVDPDGVLQREGVGIHAQSAAGLATAVRELVTDTSRRAQIGTRARHYALQQHSLRNIERVTALFAPLDTSAAAMHTAATGSGRP